MTAARCAVQEPADARLPSLDGLRGVAALVVLVHHGMLLSPVLAGHFTGEPVTGTLHRIVTYSPLHLFWAGGEAVVVFFVVSGFVLARPWLLGRNAGLGAYFMRRVTRLYLPVWAAVGLALLWRVIEHRPVPGASSWLNSHTSPVRAEEITSVVLLHRLPDANLISVLWSLHLEVLFSLLLPLLVLSMPLVRRAPKCAGVAVLSLAAVAVVTGQGVALQLGPAFLVGMCLAVHETWLRRRFGALSWPSGAGLSLSAVALLTAPWTLHHISESSPALTDAVELASAVMVMIGAGLVVGLAFWTPAARLLGYRLPQWVGRRSFSLYLVHEPVIVTLAMVFEQREVEPAFLLPAWALCLALAAFFYRVVERPSQALGRHLARREGQPEGPVLGGRVAG